MKSQILEQTSVKTKLRIEVDNDEINNERELLLKKYKKTLVVPGFRKGKAPAQLIEQKYGNYLKQESRENAIEPNLHKALEEYDLVPVTRPIINVEDPDGDKPFSFTAEFETTPIFNLEKYQGYEFTQYELIPDDEDVDNVLKRVAEQNMVFKMADRKAQDDDRVTVEVLPLIESYKDDKRIEMSFIVTKEGYFQQYYQHVNGVAVGDDLKFEVLFSAAEENPVLKGKKILSDVIVTKVEAMQSPEITDEFVKSLPGYNCNTVEELRAKILADIDSHNKNHAKSEVLNDLVEKIIADNPFDVAESLIESEAKTLIRRINRGNELPDTQKESFLNIIKPIALINVKKEAIYYKIIREQKFEVPQSEIDKVIQDSIGFEIKYLRPEVLTRYREEIENQKLISQTEDYLYSLQQVTTERLTKEAWKEKFKDESTEHSDHAHLEDDQSEKSAEHEKSQE